MLQKTLSTSASSLPIWQRFAVWLGFLAVAAALWAPVSLLAQEVRTGKLGGVCSVSAAMSGNAGDAALSGDADGSHAGKHCELCGSAGLVLPPLPVAAIPCFAGVQVVQADFPADATPADPGLPFSRGPPSL